MSDATEKGKEPESSKSPSQALSSKTKVKEITSISGEKSNEIKATFFKSIANVAEIATIANGELLQYQSVNFLLIMANLNARGIEKKLGDLAILLLWGVVRAGNPSEKALSKTSEAARRRLQAAETALGVTRQKASLLKPHECNYTRLMGCMPFQAAKVYAKMAQDAPDKVRCVDPVFVPVMMYLFPGACALWNDDTPSWAKAAYICYQVLLSYQVMPEDAKRKKLKEEEKAKIVSDVLKFTRVISVGDHVLSADKDSTWSDEEALEEYKKTLSGIFLEQAMKDKIQALGVTVSVIWEDIGIEAKSTSIWAGM